MVSVSLIAFQWRCTAAIECGFYFIPDKTKFNIKAIEFVRRWVTIKWKTHSYNIFLFKVFISEKDFERKLFGIQNFSLRKEINRVNKEQSQMTINNLYFFADNQNVH